jgi:predicted protein tyrosine phosphatase
MSRNRLHNCTNPGQGQFKKVLCVCSAGLLRSPTAAIVLSQPPFNFNTRAVGLYRDWALVPIDNVLIAWADEIVVMEPEHEVTLRGQGVDKPIQCLDIKDSFNYRDPLLMRLIAEKYKQ